MLSTKVDMSGMRALLVASIVAVVSACELKQFNNAAGLFFIFLVLIDSGMVGVFRFVFSVVWKVGKQSHNQKYVKISASNPAKMYHDV